MKNYKIPMAALIVCSIALAGFRLVAGPEDKLIAISKEYKNYSEHRNIKITGVDSSYSWTIALCKMPDKKELRYHTKPISHFISKVPVAISPHGNKLYRLFVKKYPDYLRNDSTGQPAGQVIVKETWNVNEVVYDSLNTKKTQIQSKIDGKWYTPLDISELFIMYKEGERSLTSDKGWIYGIVSVEKPNEKPIVLNNVKTSSCIRCHAGTKYDRIFGPQ